MRPADENYVLVVEDDPDMRESMESVLTYAGHAITAVADGAEALTWLTGDHPPPCVIVLDLMMPGMNGFELRSRLRADPTLSEIPVLILTGAGTLADRNRAELQAEILRKPIDLRDLLAAIHRHCALAPPRKTHAG
jgi:two-component system chemotaxis response regulator CheY